MKIESIRDVFNVIKVQFQKQYVIYSSGLSIGTQIPNESNFQLEVYV